MKKVLTIVFTLLLILAVLIMLTGIIIRLTPLFANVLSEEQFLQFSKFTTVWGTIEFPVFGTVILFIILLLDRINKIEKQ